jgi:hypothetical protein
MVVIASPPLARRGTRCVFFSIAQAFTPGVASAAGLHSSPIYGAFPGIEASPLEAGSASLLTRWDYSITPAFLSHCGGEPAPFAISNGGVEYQSA